MFTPIQMFLFFRHQRGATAVEYGLIVGLIAVVLVAVLLALGVNLKGFFQQIVTCVTTPSSCQ